MKAPPPDDEDSPDLLEAPGPFPDSLKGLKKDAPAMNVKAYAIMEWRRRPASAAPDSVTRHEAFPSWGKVLRKVALCCPSSAAAERAFSLLKLVLSSLDGRKLSDKAEAQMLMQVNDIAT